MTTKHPNKIIFTNKNPSIKNLTRLLKKRGYYANCARFRPNQIDKILEEADSNSLVFDWGCPYRIMKNDEFEPERKLAFLEQGWIPHYESISADPAGHCRKGLIPSCTLPQYSPDLEKKLRGYLNKYYSPMNRPFQERFRKHEKVKAKRHAQKHLSFLEDDKKYILFPLQFVKDSVIKFDAPKWCSDTNYVISNLLKYIPKNHKLIIKQHPKNKPIDLSIFDSEDKIIIIDTIEEPMNSFVNEILLNKCSMVIAVNSSYVLEALAHDIPTICMGEGIFTGHGVVKEYDNKNGIDNTIFDNTFVNHNKNIAFLSELCFNRQIMKMETYDESKLQNFWNKFINNYIEYWEKGNKK